MNFNKILAFAIGPLLSGGLAIFSIPLLAWCFKPEDLGRHNIYQVCMSFSVLFFVLGLDQAYVREYHESNKKDELLKACFIPGFAFLVAGLFFSVLYWQDLSLALFGEVASNWYFMLVFCALLSFVERFLSLMLRMSERGLAYSLSQVIPKVAVLCGILVIYVFDFKRSYSQLLCINLISLIFVVSFLSYFLRIDLVALARARLDIEKIKPLLTFGAPLVGASLAYWGLSASTTIVLRKFGSFTDLGLYSMAMSFAGVATIFQTIFSTIWMPMVFKWVANNEDVTRVDVVVKRVAVFVSIVFSVVGVFSFLLDYILPPEYGMVSMLVVCSVGQPLLYTLSEVTVVGLAIKRKSSFSFLASLSALFSNVAFSLILVPRFGAAGAVASNTISYFIFFVARTELAALFWRKPPRALIYGVLLIPVAGSIASVVAGEVFKNGFRFFWLALFLLMLSVFRRDVFEAIHYVKRGR